MKSTSVPLSESSGALGQLRAACKRFATVLYTTLEAVRIAALLVQPVMPESGGKLLDLLGQDAAARDFRAVGTRLAHGTVLPTPEGVFPRHQAEAKE